MDITCPEEDQISATITICERNGAAPGTATENISQILWKAVDDVTTPYTHYAAAIALGTNSYVKYNYIKFAGVFTTLANVQISHYSGNLPKGVKLVTSSSISLDTDKLSYSSPVRDKLANVSNNFNNIGATINMLIGTGVSRDPASDTGKTNTASNTGSAIYTNYFVSQLQIANNAALGDIGPITLQISYDEA